MQITPLVNGRSYDFTQITTIILGVPVPSISAISWSMEQVKEFKYGTSTNPTSLGYGARTASGSVTMSMNDIEMITTAVADQVAGSTGTLLDVPPFDIVVVFGHPTNPTTHVLKNCVFLNDGIEGSQGDTDLKKSYDLAMSHVEKR